MRYFSNRSEAGRLLVEKMKTKGDFFLNPAVLAVSAGSVLVASEIARGLHAPLYMIETENVDIPGEGTAGIASTGGNFVFSSAYSKGHLEAMQADYRPIIDQERFKAFQKLNRIVGREGSVNKKLLNRHEVILVADGLKSSLILEVVVDFIKPVDTRKIVIVTPIATIPVVDYMHLNADQVFCLGVIEDYLDTDHYYEENIIPSHKQAVEIIKNSVFTWQY